MFETSIRVPSGSLLPSRRTGFISAIIRQQAIREQSAGRLAGPQTVPVRRLAKPLAHSAGRALTVREIGALSNFDNVTVGVADVAADLAILWYWLRDELRSSAFP
jgi:hypothetical protein